ncbi:oligosaccharide flippase family protein [Ruminococcus albus]|uniref:Membrane protein involved in the export of O-antigen and teichoic acid n=1 Tax=Ruminococcus albus TaxID=1264 RepID=A0A1I1S5D4_RUMAL|nr:oligosaccharide flippase family protein [Ruminococcus albus]SFD41711.1 Membrane protein involved in the export of O-antigen and teichoic acid [Ruminococcus albus]
MSNNIKALKSGVWYTISSFLVRSIGFITTPIFSRLLTKAEFGAYSNYTSWLSIITIFVTLDLESTLISARFDYKEKFDEYILSVLSLSTLSAILWLIFTTIFIDPISSFISLDKSYIYAMLIYLFFLPAINLFQTRERYYYEYKKTVITSLVLVISSAVLSVLLVLNMQDRLTGRILGAMLPTVVIGIFFYFYFVKKGKRIIISCWKYALPICLPFIPHLLSMTLLNSTDRVMITRWCGEEDTALYSLAYNCGAIVTILLTAVNKAYGPWLAEKITENKFEDVRKFSRVYILGFVFMAIGIMLISPEVLMVLGGKKYQEAIYVMAPVSMGCICQFLYTMFVNIEQLKKKTVGMAIASVIAAFVNLMLNWIFIPRVGYLAAAYTTLVGYLVLLGIHMYLVYKIKLNKAYNYEFVIFTVLLGIVCMVIITLSYSSKIIRYIFVVLYMLILVLIFIKYKAQIISIINKKKIRGENK